MWAVSIVALSLILGCDDEEQTWVNMISLKSEQQNSASIIKAISKLIGNPALGELNVNPAYFQCYFDGIKTSGAI